MLPSEADPDELILEGIVTTISPDDSTNISPMGPVVDRSMSRLRLRPFQTSRTYANLKVQRAGVFHVTDDVQLLARAAIGQLNELPPLQECPNGHQRYLSEACRWYEFEVLTLDDRAERTNIECRVVQTGRVRDFFGWNRAQHAVVEAAILATRTHLLPHASIMQQLDHLRVIVDKTAGHAESQAFQTVVDYVQSTSQAQTVGKTNEVSRP